MTLTQLFTNIANAIRAKTGSSETIKAENFPTEIADITTGTDTSDANAEPINIRKDKTAYVNGEKITGTLPVLTYPVNPDNPSDFDYQFIEASTAKKVTRASTYYIMGAYQIAGNNEPDSWMFEGNRKMKLGIAQSKVATAISLKGEQIKKGEKILGVTGTYEGQQPSGDYNTIVNAIPKANQNNVSKILVELPELDLVNITTATNFFSSSPLNKILVKNTQNITNFSYFFSNCSNLEYIPDELDCSSATNLSNMFYSCSKIEKVKLINTQRVETTASMFQQCSTLDEVELGTMENLVNCNSMFYSCVKLKTIPLFNTSNVVGNNANSMFYNCTSLENIPVFDFRKITRLTNLFYKCSSLTNESLNNILAICINAKSITSASYKTLKYIGLTSEQATTCQTLSNWDDFVAAGWTTGY